MLFFSSNNKHSTEKNFSHCYGCGLCTLVCPVWQQTRDVSVTPHGHAKAVQIGGDINIQGLFDCVLCGACESVCPEDIPIMVQLIALRVQSGNQPEFEFFASNENNKANQTRQTLLLADNALLEHKTLSGQQTSANVLALLNSTNNSIKMAADNGGDISQAMLAGINIPASRKAQFIESIKGATKLIVSDGLLKRLLQQWLPGIEIVSLGYVLSCLPGIENKLGAKDLYIIESQAYHADLKNMLVHYDALRRKCGCALNLDLQRLAIPAAGLAGDQQGQWILQGLSIERIIVENTVDAVVMERISGKPVIHVSELVGNA